MRFLLILFIGMVPVAPGYCQGQHAETYAVVIGISRYESGSGIPSLEYADKDATIFSEYLQSKAGGIVPADHIKLLVNENATYTAVYSALNWLLRSCKKNDVAYFYFSGHGDKENITLYNLGYLLCYNTPFNNYNNNALRLEDLNNYTNTLSVSNNSKAILITDACHSGNLAGKEFRGTYLVGEKLRTAKKNEIRITSCADNQLSAEGEGWGGGRGVFSWYLINGLKGLADKKNDGHVTVNEIKNYLDSSLAADPLLAEKKETQTPVITGIDSFRISSVDLSSLSSVKPIVGLAPLPKQPIDYLYDAIRNTLPEDFCNFSLLDSVPKQEIAFAFINGLPEYIKEKIPGDNLQSLTNTLKQNKSALDDFNIMLVEFFSNRGQTLINDYLKGEAAEIERRSYYNSLNGHYDDYPKMFSIAMKLTDPSDYLYSILEIKLHYFTGVAARLKIPFRENYKPLEELAMAEQKKAMALDSNAAYIQNELGILYKSKEQYDMAETCLLKATMIAPTWSIPWANLVGLYAAEADFEKGIAAFEKARSLQFDFQGNYVNAGLLYEKKGDLLTAEEYYRKSIEINPQHYLPHERLGFVYTKTARYKEADVFFREANEKKKGLDTRFFVRDNEQPRRTDITMMQQGHLDYNDCKGTRPKLLKNDLMGYFVLAQIDFSEQNHSEGENKLRYIITHDRSSFLACHALAERFMTQEKYLEAEILFNMAIASHIDKSAFDKYCDSMKRFLPKNDTCIHIGKKYRDSYYPALNDHYQLALLYRRWNHPEQAAAQYRLIMSINPSLESPYYWLWTLYESMGRYYDAEQVILDYGKINQDGGINELYSFYDRVCFLQPGNGEWHYKTGLFLYNHAAKHAASQINNINTASKEMPVEVELMPDEDMIVKKRSDNLYENFRHAEYIDEPGKKAIVFLMKADSLMQYDDVALTDIGHKLGDLYLWQGEKQRAAEYYKRSVAVNPMNADIQSKLVDNYLATYQYKNAIEYLDSMQRHNQIDLPHLLSMTELYVYSGQFTEATVLLKQAESAQLISSPATTAIKGKLISMSAKPADALSWWLDYYTSNNKDYNAMYTISRLYAKMNDQQHAFKWLGMALKKGFNYTYVLRADDAWNNYYKLKQWQTLTGIKEN